MLIYLWDLTSAISLYISQNPKDWKLLSLNEYNVILIITGPVCEVSFNGSPTNTNYIIRSEKNKYKNNNLTTNLSTVCFGG